MDQDEMIIRQHFDYLFREKTDDNKVGTAATAANIYLPVLNTQFRVHQDFQTSVSAFNTCGSKADLSIDINDVLCAASSDDFYTGSLHCVVAVIVSIERP